MKCTKEVIARGQIVASVFPGMKDAAIRQAVKECPNGEYAFKICRQCGAYWVQPNGNTDTAYMVDACSVCLYDNK